MSYKTISSSFGENIKVTISGGSHEPHIGVEVQGLPEGIIIDTEELHRFMQRRAPGNNAFTTSRREPDIPEFITGVRACVGTDFAKSDITESATTSTDFTIDNTQAPDASSEQIAEVTIAETAKLLITTGEPLKVIIKNTNTRSSDYARLRDIPRPGHADYTARIKYGDTVNMAGGGPFSARMTAPLCIVGGIALQYLKTKGIHIGAHIRSIGGVQGIGFDPVNVDLHQLENLKTSAFPCLDNNQRELMQQEILKAKEELDSVGGVVEAAIVGLPAGLGGPMYDGVESKLAPILFGIPAVKGVEFGNGFEASTLRGSQNNDPFTIENTTIKTTTNNHGGILGGITSGMPLICRLAFKSTPSIGMAQQSVNISNMQPETLQIQGRHDPCVAVRAVPIVEAALAVGILDLLFHNINK